MEKKYINKDIFYIENFLNDELLSEVVSVIDNDGSWVNDDVSLSTPSIKYFNDELKHKLKQYFDNNLQYPDMPSTIRKMDPFYVSRYKEDQFLFSHWDGNPLEHPEAKFRYAIILYINDNFEGGELFYSKINTLIKPKKNMLVCHKADSSDYEHEIKPVITGKRYSVTSFIYCCSNSYEDCKCDIDETNI